MEYLSSLISKWMPNKSKVAVDSHPRLSGVMDTVNATLAHGPETRLPAPFYDTKGLEIIDKIAVEEWFSGYKENNEYRKVGVGALAGDIVARMVGSVKKNENDAETSIKFGMSGCHDTTLAALLSSLGCFDGQKWPPYTSHIAFELFKEAQPRLESTNSTDLDEPIPASTLHVLNRTPIQKLFGRAAKPGFTPAGAPRKPLEDMNSTERKKLSGHYVRIRYNDRPMTIPGCKLPGKHLDGDESFCTLVRTIVRVSLI